MNIFFVVDLNFSVIHVFKVCKADLAVTVLLFIFNFELFFVRFVTLVFINLVCHLSGVVYLLNYLRFCVFFWRKSLISKLRDTEVCGLGPHPWHQCLTYLASDEWVNLKVFSELSVVELVISKGEEVLCLGNEFVSDV